MIATILQLWRDFRAIRTDLFRHNCKINSILQLWRVVGRCCRAPSGWSPARSLAAATPPPRPAPAPSARLRPHLGERLPHTRHRRAAPPGVYEVVIADDAQVGGDAQP